MFLSQGKRPVARKPLAAVSQLASMYCLIIRQFYRERQLALGFKTAIFQFFTVEFFQGTHESFIQGLNLVAVVRWEEMMST
jgi:hypothetical protein